MLPLANREITTDCLISGRWKQANEQIVQQTEKREGGKTKVITIKEKKNDSQPTHISHEDIIPLFFFLSHKTELPSSS